MSTFRFYSLWEMGFLDSNQVAKIFLSSTPLSRVFTLRFSERLRVTENW